MKKIFVAVLVLCFILVVFFAVNVKMSAGYSSASASYGISDFLDLIKNWFKSFSLSPGSDVNNDGVVDSKDLGRMMRNWDPNLSAAQSPLGVGFGEKYDSQIFVQYIEDLGVKNTHVTIKWDEFEPNSGVYNFSKLDAFLGQIGPNIDATVRITTRFNAQENGPGNWMPKDLSVGGHFYNYVYKIVERSKGKVKYFENEWEADCTDHFLGTPEQYAAMTRAFYKAVKDADPNALVIMGGTLGNYEPCAQTFFSKVFQSLASDTETSSFDAVDVHLYYNLYDIPQRISAFRSLMNKYSEFIGKPIFVFEYGGPTPREFKDAHLSAYNSLTAEIQANPCIINTDLAGYPDQLRMMFSFGLGASGKWLEEKRDRIQGRQMAQRTLLALSAGAERMIWWKIMSNGGEYKSEYGCTLRDPMFDKLALLMNQTKLPAFNYYKTIATYLNDAKKVERVATSDDSKFYLFKITKYNNSSIFAVWEKRDQFSGENNPAVDFTFSVPWQSAKVTDLFGAVQNTGAVGGKIMIKITDTPVFVVAGT